MQAVTQASLDPPCDDISHVVTKQEFCGVTPRFDTFTEKLQANPATGLHPSLYPYSVRRLLRPFGFRHH